MLAKSSASKLAVRTLTSEPSNIEHGSSARSAFAPTEPKQVSPSQSTTVESSSVLSPVRVSASASYPSLLFASFHSRTRGSGLMAAISSLSKNCILYCTFWLKKFLALILTIAIVSVIYGQNESIYRIDRNEFTFVPILCGGLGLITGLIGIGLSYFNYNRQTKCRTAFVFLVCEIQL